MPELERGTVAANGLAFPHTGERHGDVVNSVDDTTIVDELASLLRDRENSSETYS
jgi:hypothetical protein